MVSSEPILRALTFIEDHLEQEITVADMAQVSGYSLYHFCRIFSAVVHFSPYEYLMRRRLSAASDMVLHSEDKIIDVANRFRFNSPEVFARAFKRTFYQLPSIARKNNSFDEIRALPGIGKKELKFFENRFNPFESEPYTFVEDQKLQGVLLPIPANGTFDVANFSGIIRDLGRIYSSTLPSIWGSITWVPVIRNYYLFCGIPDSKGIPLDLFLPKTIFRGKYKNMNLNATIELLPECLRWLILFDQVQSDTEETSIYFRIPEEGPINLFV